VKIGSRATRSLGSTVALWQNSIYFGSSPFVSKRTGIDFVLLAEKERKKFRYRREDFCKQYRSNQEHQARASGGHRVSRRYQAAGIAQGGKRDEKKGCRIHVPLFAELRSIASRTRSHQVANRVHRDAMRVMRLGRSQGRELKGCRSPNSSRARTWLIAGCHARGPYRRGHVRRAFVHHACCSDRVREAAGTQNGKYATRWPHPRLTEGSERHAICFS